MKFANLNNIDGPRKTREALSSDEPSSYPLSNGSTTGGAANGDTENDESTEDRSELDSSEMDDVSFFNFYYSFFRFSSSSIF